MDVFLKEKEDIHFFVQKKEHKEQTIQNVQNDYCSQKYCNVPYR